ncbi:hypothetical protein HDU91_002704 [Kappamyces sp. JEL0680]|nr:hypothetical protein HDU91_002704 [Kappamyces sp. JEL0680]
MAALSSCTSTGVVQTTPRTLYQTLLTRTKPGSLWFGPHVAEAVLDIRPQGFFYHLVSYKDNLYPHLGRFLVLQEDDRDAVLELTWMSKSTKGFETTVRFSMVAQNDQETLLTIVQSGLPDQESADQQKEGWDWMVTAIQAVFDKNKPAEGV